MAEQLPAGRRGRWLRLGAAAAVVASLVVAQSSVLARGAVDPNTFPTAVNHDLDFAQQRVNATSTRIPAGSYPVRTSSSGAWVTVPASDWTSGFYPGTLWQMYERTGDPTWRTKAETVQKGIESQKTNNSTHDLGFMFLSSYGRGYKDTGDLAQKQVLLTAANTLTQRWNPAVGAMRSWDAYNDTTQYRVIIDNMMNLELWFWAAQNGGDPTLRDKAISHAKVTQRDFFRPDGGSFHVVNYNQTTGAVISKGTAQGYSDSSTWARGEAWGIHGFTTTYRYTGDVTFLDTARRSADYYLSHLPADKIPYWDFNLPSTTGQPRDTSAAAIAASGMVELSRLETDPVRKQNYLDGAQDTIAALSSPGYLSEGTNNQAVLLHGTQNKPANNYDTGLIFGDYYFIEALQRWQAWNGTTTPPSTTTTAAPALGLAVSPASHTIRKGSTTTYGVTVNRPAGNTTPVTMSVSGQPSPSNVTFDPTTTSANSTLTVRTYSSTSRGTYPLTITGTYGNGTKVTVTATLVVTS